LCRDYFDYFARLPNLQVTAYQPNVRLVGDYVAINDGYYVFNYRDEQWGHEKRARFTFVYRKNPITKQWEIIDHHSSALPQAPPTLKRGRTVLL